MKKQYNIFLKSLLLSGIILLTTNKIYAQWSLTGNSITSSNWLGSTNDVDVIVKRNNIRAGFLNSANGNTSWGVGSLNPSSPNTANTAIGYNVLPSNSSGGDNTGIGYNALYSNGGGGYNVATGYQALYSNSSGNFNVANGMQALYTNSSGGGNDAIGYQSLYVNSIGTQNNAFGYNSLSGNTTGSENVGFGASTLTVNTTGIRNTAIGSYANVASAALTYATAIGCGAIAGQSNSLELGGTGIYAVNVGVGTATPNASALLDLTTTNRGLLLPRIALTSTTLATPLAAHVAGMTVYNTATAGSGITAVVPGIYYDNGTSWLNITSSNQGLTLPNVALTGTTAATPLSAHVAGTTVYNTATAGSGTTAVTPGIYYDNGTAWVSVSGGTTTFAGTNNYLAKYSPTGASIGTSQIFDNGSFVGINTMTAPAGYAFAVNGKAIFNKVVVENYGNWADYVFQKNYVLPSLDDVEKYINQNQHLQGVPSAVEVEKNGVDIADNQVVLLKKVEELTLYVIDQNKKIEVLQSQNNQLKDLAKEVEDLKALLKKTK